MNNVDNEDEFKRISKTYRPVELKKWRTAPVVKENPGKPGEMGKAVKMKSYQQEEMKEKFKENQFNLLASDMILLNRSLADVRHKELSSTFKFPYHKLYLTSCFPSAVAQKLSQQNCQRPRSSSFSTTKLGLHFCELFGASSIDRRDHC